MRRKSVAQLILIILVLNFVSFPLPIIKADPAYPVVEEIAESTHVGETTHVTNYPTIVDAGDLLIAVFTCDDNEVVTFPNEGSDWNTIYNEDAGAQGPTLAVAWREAVGDEDGGTFEITTGGSEGSCAYVFRISGAEDPDTQAPEASTEATGSGVNPDSLSLSPTGGSKEYLWISAEGNDDDDDTTGWPSNMADNNVFLQVASVTLGVATEEGTTDAFDPAQFTIAATESWEAVTIAIHPPSIAGDSYYRYVTQAVSFASSLYRTWSTSRLGQQSLTWSGSIERGAWSTSRESPLSLTLASNLEREWTLLREVTQGYAFSFNIDRAWTLSRTVTQGLTFAWEAIGEIISGQSYSRTVTLSITSTLNAIKGAWSLTRVVTQPLTMTFNVLREWTLLRTVSQGITFTWDAYGSRFIEYLFDLRVTDSLLPLGNAMVQILRGSSTIWTGQTFDNGSISTQSLPENNYSLYVELDGFIPYESLLNLNTNINWDVALTTLTFNLPFFGFIMLASAALYIGWKQERPTDSLWAYFFSLVFWIATMYQWFIDNGTAYPAFLYLFFFPILTLVFFIYEEATKYYEEAMQGGYKGDPFG